MKFVPGLGGGDGEQVAKFKFSVYLKNVQFFGEMAGSVAFPAATIPTSWASGAPGAATAPHSSNIALLFFSAAQPRSGRGKRCSSCCGGTICQFPM